MIIELIHRLHNPDYLQNVFYLGEIAFGFLIFIGFIFFRPRVKDSNFRVREADLQSQNQTSQGAGSQGQGAIDYDPNRLANAKMKMKRPLQLGGIRIDGSPYEILGVQENASAADIQKAYRDRMKQYHPDKIGTPGSREWKDAQKIAEAINLAKDALLKKKN